ncbi:MAG: long-chain fatty acid--CoA ligase [Chloroflexi bacterium]|nr:long-chain fatty acid--CoA ligase [Chloroflexota bacterium]
MPSQNSYYVTDWLDKRAKFSRDKIALRDTITNRDITYAEWNAQANRAANFLRAWGIGKGDRVAVYSNNRVEYLDVLFACGKIGAVVQNLNWRLTVAELEGIINDAAPVALVYSGEWSANVNLLRAKTPSARHFIALDAPASPDDRAFSECDTYPDTLAAPPDLHPDDLWAIYYTGGTTGLPKGAMVTHGNATWNSINTVMTWGLTADDVSVMHLPLFHTGGLHIFALPLIHVGGTTIICKAFDVEQTFDLIASAGVTVFVGVPTMFLMMQQHPRWEQADFSGLKLIISGGAPCPQPIAEKFWARGVDFKIGYGLTEAPVNNFWLPPEDVRRKPGSAGFPLFHVDMRIVTPDGIECGADEPGELLIRGPHVSPGYWNRPEATAETFVDGWLHTGDLARRDAEGYYTIIGRSKDMFISGGENVYPAEVESVMHAHPAVSDAALIGVPDEKWGEVGRAILVLKPGCQLSEADFLNFLRDRLAKYKLPKSVVIIDRMPKTAIGKTDKKLLAQQYGG